jgi:hypothetical protein
MANTFKKVIDAMTWRQVTPAATVHAVGRSLCCDMRNDSSRDPFVYHLATATVVDRFNMVTKGWQSAAIAPALAGTFGVGAACVFLPSFAAVGTLAAGATTTSMVLSTALPAAVGVNMLGNRGGSGDFGFRIRIAIAASGRVEERFIVANTGGTTPTITVSPAFTSAPASGDRYEILSGKLAMLNAGTLASNIWRTYEIASNFLSTGLTTTNLPATIATDSSFVALDEQYVPFDCSPGEGFIRGTFDYDSGKMALAATAAAAGTITGQATGGDVAVLANEYRNFQIRVVYDAVTPASVGQRRIIASHTAGPSAVYTLGANWTTTPSSSAKFVIEYPNLLLLRSSATTTVYTYNYTDATVNNGTNNITAGSWSTTYFGVAGAANAVGGFWVPAFGIRPDVAKNSRHSHLFFFRGGASGNLDLLDISGSITGTWSAAVVYDGAWPFGAGSCGAYSPYGNEGRYCYIDLYNATTPNATAFRFDVQNRVLSPNVARDIPQAGTATAGARMAAYAAIDGADKYDVVMSISHLAGVCQELIPLV